MRTLPLGARNLPHLPAFLPPVKDRLGRSLEISELLRDRREHLYAHFYRETCLKTPEAQTRQHLFFTLPTRVLTGYASMAVAG